MTHDVYLVDQRGVGRSTRLGCPAEEAKDSAGSYAITSEEWPSCLAMQGGAKAAFTGPRQTFVELPGGSHGVLLGSPVRDAGAVPCGTSLLVSFLASAGEALDTRCVARLAPVAFDRSRAAEDFFGTVDPWGD